MAEVEDKMEKNLTEKIFQAFAQADYQQAHLLLQEEAANIASTQSAAYYWHQNTIGYYYTFTKKFQEALDVYEKNLTLAQFLEDKELEHIALHQQVMVLREI